MPNWKQDKSWSDLFIPEIQRLLAPILIQVAPPIEDMEHNTDLLVLTINGHRIACRVREHRWLRNFGEQFTIRANRPSGKKTELEKIVEGFGSVFFYGFAGLPGTTVFSRWMAGDLNVFRGVYHQMLKDGMPIPLVNNPDGSSDFHPFNIRCFPREFFLGMGGYENVAPRRAWVPIRESKPRPKPGTQQGLLFKD